MKEEKKIELMDSLEKLEVEQKNMQSEQLMFPQHSS